MLNDLLHKIPPEWVYALLAMVGGAARYLNMYLVTGKFQWGNLVANIIISGFSGFIFGLVANTMALPQTMSLVFAGVGGFMGSNALEFLSAQVTKRMRLP